MRFSIFVFLMFVFQNSYSQLSCEDDNLALNQGDYPPGCVVCSPIVTADNFGYTSDDTLQYDFPCGAVENSIWFTLFTSTDGQLSFNMTAKNCKNGSGLEAAIYDKDLNKVSNCFSLFNDVSTTFYVALPESKTYYLMIDGIDGDECEFGFFVNGLIRNQNVNGFISSSKPKFCTGEKICFEPQFLGTKYNWTVPATDSIISGGGIRDEEICLWFDSLGRREIQVQVENPCQGTFEFRTSFEVDQGPFIVIDSLFSDRTEYCQFDEVVFFYNWQNDTVAVDWNFFNSSFRRLDGGTQADNFFKGEILQTGSLSVSVEPIHECGLLATNRLSIPRAANNQVDSVICSSACIMVKDSCYSESGSHTIDLDLLSTSGCDSFMILDITVINVFPSPTVNCSPSADGIQLDWSLSFGEEEFVIFINRDSFATVDTNSYFIENVPEGASINIKIQPLGICTYLPAEVTCTNLISKTEDNFLKNKISIFPNPTTGKLNIKTDLKIESVEVFDIAGQLLQKEKTTSFKLENRDAGIYILKIKTNEGVGVKRVLVN